MYPNRSLSARLFIIVSIVPFVVLYCALYVLPLLQGFLNSLYIWSGVTSVKKFCGIKNYVELLGDRLVWLALKNDFVILVFKELFILVISLFFAVSLTRFAFAPGESGFYRTLFYFPNVMSIVVIAMLWSFIYHPSLGLLNGTLKAVGMGGLARAWLGDATTVIGAIIPVSVWCGIGFYMVLFIAGINGIPRELYEASVIDGAGEWMQFTHVTFPLLWAHMKFAFVSIMFSTLNGNFAFIQLMTNGGPANASQVLGFYMYRNTFQTYRAGYASAVGVLMFVIAIVLTLATQRSARIESMEA
jgi:N-acetylglucosamine transport system permease protein